MYFIYLYAFYLRQRSRVPSLFIYKNMNSDTVTLTPDLTWEYLPSSRAADLGRVPWSDVGPVPSPTSKWANHRSCHTHTCVQFFFKNYGFLTFILNTNCCFRQHISSYKHFWSGKFKFRTTLFIILFWQSTFALKIKYTSTWAIYLISGNPFPLEFFLSTLKLSSPVIVKFLSYMYL